MDKELKDLLLKDLCARLPYEVKIKVLHYERYDEDPSFCYDTFSTIWYNILDYEDESYEIIPYLRPISSMTKEEQEELDNLNMNPFSGSVTDWLNAHHFDYRMTDDGRTMIEAGLALSAPEGMYKIE